MAGIINLLKKVGLYALLTLFLLAITGYVYLYILPKGPALTPATALARGKDSFVIYAYKESKKRSIRVHTYQPKNWGNGNDVMFVMHGGGRNASDYLDAWISLADTMNLLIIAPEFESKFYRYITNDYQEGNVTIQLQ